MATPIEIQQFKERMKKWGCCGYSINGRPEDESIAQAIDESWSFLFVAVHDPYYEIKKRNGRAIRFRIMQVLKDNPQIPMGYSGMPLVTFECYTGDPVGYFKGMFEKKSKKLWRFKLDREGGDKMGNYVTAYYVGEKEEVKA